MKSDVKPILMIVAAAMVLVFAVLALRSTTSETQILPRVDLPPPGAVGPTGDPIAVVTSTRKDQETSFFGLWKGQTHYLVGVQFYAPADCSTLLAQGDPWPASSVACSTEVPVAGTVTGLGIAATGETIVMVEVETSEACFLALDGGDLWPPDAPACAA